VVAWHICAEVSTEMGQVRKHLDDVVDVVQFCDPIPTEVEMRDAETGMRLSAGHHVAAPVLVPEFERLVEAGTEIVHDHGLDVG